MRQHRLVQRFLSRTSKSYEQTYDMIVNRQGRYLIGKQTSVDQVNSSCHVALLHNRPAPTLMIWTCILSAGFTAQSQNLVAGPEKSTGRGGEWSEDKSLGACLNRELRRVDWMRNRWHFCTLCRPSRTYMPLRVCISTSSDCSLRCHGSYIDENMDDRAAPGRMEELAHTMTSG